MKKRRENRYARIRMDTAQHLRLRLGSLVLGIMAFVPIAARLFQLMVVDYDYYSTKALRNQTRSTAVLSERGTVYDRNMNILAQSEAAEHVYLDPHELKQSKADLKELSVFLGELLDKDPQWIYEQGSDRRRRYKQVASLIPFDTADKIRAYILEEGIAGVHLEPSAKRSYPFGELASQVVGFTNLSGQGSEGVEAAYDAFLSGPTAKVITTKGSNEMDMPFSYEALEVPKKACNVILTLDTTVQSCLENRLKEAIARYDVQNGAFGLVMNCKTGEILAMATVGGYDPNDYQRIADDQVRATLEKMEAEYKSHPEKSEEYTEGKKAYEVSLTQARLRQWRNRVLSDGYEPGSTFKVLTMAAALDCGAIDLNTSFYCRGAEKIPGRSQLLHCWRSAGHGAEQTPQALQNSCNLAFAHIALKLGGERFYDYVKRYGILEKTGIDLSGESKGVFFDKDLITNTDKWGTASLTSGSFGQTFKITPLQLVRGIASVVNGGRLLEPYIVSEIQDEKGNVVLKQEPTVVRRTIREETSQVMRTLIRSVVTEGTAKNASVAGFSIGGKTGTSEKIDVFDENGQRVLDKIVSFVGIAPMEDPEYIVLAALDTPSRSTGIYISGGVMAAPTVGAVMADILPYLGVQKSEEPERVSLEDLTGLSRKEAEKQLKAQGLTSVFQGSEETVTDQLPKPGERVSTGSQVLVYLGQPPQTAVVPELLGKNRTACAYTAGEKGLAIQPEGNLDPNAIAIAQDPAPGTEVQAGSRIRTRFADQSAGEP